MFGRLYDSDEVNVTSSTFPIADFEKNGFALVPAEANILDHIEKLKNRAAEIVAEADLLDAGTFSTTEQQKNSDAYFMDSAHEVRCFVEEDQTTGTTGHRINKIGHALHRLDPTFQAFVSDVEASSLLGSLGFQVPKVAQSMFIFKRPFIGGEVLPHRDASFIKTKPASCKAFWWALDDADQENGCMYVKPGSHTEAFDRDFIACHKSKKAWFTGEEEAAKIGFMPVVCQKGTLVIMDGGLLHYSDKNTSSRNREAFTLHVVESEGTVWRDDNWIPSLF